MRRCFFWTNRTMGPWRSFRRSPLEYLARTIGLPLKPCTMRGSTRPETETSPSFFSRGMRPLRNFGMSVPTTSSGCRSCRIRWSTRWMACLRSCLPCSGPRRWGVFTGSPSRRSLPRSTMAPWRSSLTNSIEGCGRSGNWSRPPPACGTCWWRRKADSFRCRRLRALCHRRKSLC